MSVRMLTLILVCAAAAGCGGDRTPEATPTEGPSGEGLDMKLAVEPDPPRSGQPVTWTLLVTNQSSEPVTVEMPSGKKGDIVLTRDGQEVYRWSDDRFFTLALVTETFQPQETKTFELTDDGFAIEPGAYQLEATSTAEPGPPPVRRTITIEP